MDINKAIEVLRAGAPERLECRTAADVHWENQRLEAVRLEMERRRWAWGHEAPAPGHGIDGYPLMNK